VGPAFRQKEQDLRVISPPELRMAKVDPLFIEIIKNQT